MNYYALDPSTRLVVLYCETPPGRKRLCSFSLFSGSGSGAAIFPSDQLHRWLASNYRKPVSNPSPRSRPLLTGILIPAALVPELPAASRRSRTDAGHGAAVAANLRAEGQTDVVSVRIAHIYRG